LPKNSDYAQKPTISFKDAMYIINQNNVLLTEGNDLGSYVKDWLRPSKIE